MCGIAGLLTPAGRDLAPAARRMARALVHRGPDGEGVWSDADEGVALAHRRLAIIDLSPAGAQPMASACGRFVLTYNGEIYNYRAVRAELDAEGRAPSWRGRSDTEVMLAAIAAWGLEAALRRFNGMFAFALWDRTVRTLTLARDRFGEKPLYYGRVGSDFLFGSELRALQAHPSWRDPPLDRAALDHTVRFAYGPADRTLFAGVRKVPPGAFVKVTAAGEAGAPIPFWSALEAAAAAAASPFQGDTTEAADAVEQALAASVAMRLESDVPLGVLLSGGIDSSLITALTTRAGPARVHSFSIGFPDQGFDESAHAQAIAAHLGTQHTTLTATLAEARAVVPLLPDIYDEPFADSSQVPTYLVSRLARQHVTVALTGDGGDELFGGYTRYAMAPALWARLARIPRSLRAAGAQIAMTPVADGVARAVAARFAGPGYAATGERLRKALRVAHAADPDALYRGLCTLWPAEATLVPGAAPDLAEPAATPALFPDFAARMMAADAVTYLPGDILTKVDRAAMAVSLEGRMPFLDPDVFKLAWSLPMRLKIAEGRGKHILRTIAGRHIPPALLDRPKQGFAAPIDAWLRSDLRDWAEALLAPRRIRDDGWFAPDLVAQTWAAHVSGREDAAARLWPILMVNAWADAWAARRALSAAV